MKVDIGHVRLGADVVEDQVVRARVLVRDGVDREEVEGDDERRRLFGQLSEDDRPVSVRS